MCLYPKLITNPKYKSNKKNGGKIPPLLDIRIGEVPIGCGKCIECMKQKAREWQIRLTEDIREYKNANFVTLTFSEESLLKLTRIALKDLNEIENEYIITNETARIAVRRFLERWRKKHKKSVRHWLITELGHENTERIHLHGIIYAEDAEEIEKIWSYGWVYIGDYVNERTVNYITKYITKTDLIHKEYKPKIFTSSGIGKNYFNRKDWELNKYKEENTDEAYKFKNGTKSSLPIYYRNKIYSEEEREKLWIKKLDKEERWVCGERISIKENEEEYEKTREYYRKKNKRLGYGDDNKNFDEELYKKKMKLLRSAKPNTKK